MTCSKLPQIFSVVGIYFLYLSFLLGFSFSVDSEHEGPCLCSRERAEVCGSDGKTYTNNCTLSCAKRRNADLRLVHDGRCVCPDPNQNCGCPRLEEEIYDPVCGSDNETYNNECILNCERNKNCSLTCDCCGQCPCGASSLPCGEPNCWSDTTQP